MSVPRVLAAAQGIARALKADAASPEAKARKELLKLAGKEHHPYDSFSLTMQAVAASFGRRVDYDRVYALSTNAFAPDIRPDEECRQHWRMRGRGQCLDLVADALGLKVRPLGCFTNREYRGPGVPEFPWREKAKEAAAAARAALANGEVVITDSGWLADFMLWGVVVEVEDDGRITGVTPNGHTANTFDHACSFWALSPKEESLGAREADVRMLRRAAARIRADRDPFLPGSLVYGLPAIGAPGVPGAVIWGLPAMDRWIEQMGKVPYQQDDAESSLGNATLCMWHTQHGAEVAAKELKAAAKRLGGSARPHALAAASRYERIADLLRPGLAEEGPGSLAGIMGDAARQNEYVEEVLRPVRREMASAADDIESALGAVVRNETFPVSGVYVRGL